MKIDPINGDLLYTCCDECQHRYLLTCEHGKFISNRGTPRHITDDDLSEYFPSWCPLEDVKEGDDYK